MATNQSGKSLPFATKDGKPIDDQRTNAKPTDFTKSASGAGDGTPPRHPADYAPTTSSDRGPGLTGAAGAHPHLQSRAQRAYRPEEDSLAQDSIVPGGKVLKADPGPGSRSDGAQGLTGQRRPFKGLR
jgi:hypothetical protein